VELMLSYASFETNHKGSADIGSGVDSDFTIESLAKLLGDMHTKTINTLVVVVGFEIRESSENFLDKFIAHTTTSIGDCYFEDAFLVSAILLG